MSPRDRVRGLLLILPTVLAAACGGGGGGGTVPAAPTMTLAAISVAVGTPTALTWSSADATSCTASGSWSGTLATSGTQTITPAAAGTFTYTLTCANSAGSSKASTATLTATALTYGSPNYQYTVGIAANTLTPSNTGSIKSWSMSPALPAGLTFDTTTGAISGTPTVDSPTTTYVITGASSGGDQTKLDLAIGVTSNILLNLGHVDSLQLIQFDTLRVLTEDTSGRWILWNYATAAQIASGVALISYAPFYCSGLAGCIATTPAQMAFSGPTVVIQSQNGLETRSSATGQVLAEISVDLALVSSASSIDPLSIAGWWKLATDGSYVCGGNATGLTCWSPSGQMLFTESGNYAAANVIALPTALLIASGAAGNGVIETVSSATWTSSVGPAFQGAFPSWFVDGSHFLTTIPAGTQIGTTIAAFNTLFVYSLASVLEDTETMPTLQGLRGQGNWFWTASATAPLTIYAIGNNTGTCMPIPCTMPTPAATYNLFSPLTLFGTFIDSISGATLTAIDLSGSTPVETSYTLPLAGLFVKESLNVYAAISPSQFIVGTNDGVVVDGSTPNSPRYFGHGALTSFAASTSRAVFTTASGETFSYNLTTNAFEAAIQLPLDVRQVALSADGGVLADIFGVAGSVDVYSMPSGTLIHSFPPPGGATIGLSSNGTLLTECCAMTVPVTGGAATSYPFGLAPAQLSPDGTSVAVSSSVFPGTTGFGVTPPKTDIYKNGALVATLPGWSWVLGWPTNSSVIVSTFSLSGPLFMNGEASDFTFSGDEIYSATGVSLGSSPIGANYFVQFASDNLVFANYSNTILSATTGAAAWASADQPVVLAVPNPVGALPASFFIGSAVVFGIGKPGARAAVLTASHRIRHYGLFAKASRKHDIAAARELLHQPAPELPPNPGDDSTGNGGARTPFVCRHCAAPMIVIETLARAQHILGPPCLPSSP